MKNTLSRRILTAVLLLLPFSLYAGEGTANAALVSDYILRGETASNNKAAVQIGYEYDYNNALSVGAWLSTVPTGYEYDLYTRYGAEFGQWGYSLGVIYYGYTGTASAPAEVNLSLSYHGFSLMASRGEGVSYNEAVYEKTVSDIGLGLRLHFGFDGTDPDYGLQLLKSFSSFDIALNYATKINTATTIATDVYAVSVSKAF